MKKTFNLLAVFFLMVILLPMASISQEPPGNGDGGLGKYSKFSRMYNPDTVVTVSGVVEKIENVMPFRGVSQGVHLVLKTKTEVLSVHLGPAWYINAAEMVIVSGDELDVTGSKIDFEGEPALIASMIKKNDRILKLRDNNGIPLWSGGPKK